MPAVRWNWLVACAAFAFSMCAARSASAYPWMIRHAYTQCAACHVDPMGSGPLTPYGRALGEIVLTMPWGAPSGDETPAAEFLWGAVPVPDGILLGGDLRVMRLATKVPDVPLDTRLIYMQLDAEVGLMFERFAGAASLGYAPEGALGSAITRGPDDNLVSRQHWLGFAVVPETVMIRAGRLNLPFGIRSTEHTLWVRSLTHTSINDDQQYGLSVSVETPVVRGEAMAIAGNYQLRPSEFRERGYSASVEWTPDESFALGASSLVTHRELDPRRLDETLRHAHGLTLRWRTPYEPLVLLSEWDYVFESTRNAPWRQGIVGYTQGDLEPFRGIHFMLTFEANQVGVEDSPPISYGTWLSYAWFFATHADLRLDNIYQSIATPGGRVGAWSWLVQAHVYL